MTGIPVVGTIEDGLNGEPVVHLPQWLIDRAPMMWVASDGTEYCRYGRSGQVKQVIRDPETMEVVEMVALDRDYPHEIHGGDG